MWQEECLLDIYSTACHGVVKTAVCLIQINDICTFPYWSLKASFTHFPHFLMHLSSLSPVMPAHLFLLLHSAGGGLSFFE